MPSEPAVDAGWRRLHPLTMLFALGSKIYGLRALLLPALLALFVSRRRSDGGWQDFEGWLLRAGRPAARSSSWSSTSRSPTASIRTRS